MSFRVCQQAGTDLADDDFRNDRVIALFEDPTEPIDSLGRSAQMVDDERRIEEQSHVIQASGP